MKKFCEQGVKKKIQVWSATNLQPPPSVPNAAEHNPEATIAAGPEDDPPVYLSGACGFLVVLHVNEPSPN